MESPKPPPRNSRRKNGMPLSSKEIVPFPKSPPYPYSYASSYKLY